MQALEIFNLVKVYLCNFLTFDVVFWVGKFYYGCDVAALFS